MRKRFVAVAIATVASLSIGGLLTASAAPIKDRDPCKGQAVLIFVEPGTTGDLNGDGRICVTDA